MKSTDFIFRGVLSTSLPDSVNKAERGPCWVSPAFLSVGLECWEVVHSMCVCVRALMRVCACVCVCSQRSALGAFSQEPLTLCS